MTDWTGVSSPLAGAQVVALSLGAGVQSSTLALMAARGDIGPMPTVAFFADTGWEPIAVYKWLVWLETQLPFPVVRVSRSGLDLGEFSIAAARGDIPRKGSPLPPWFTKDPDGALPLQCSKEFKTRPITLALRSMIGLVPGERGPSAPIVEQWLGISTDETSRLKFHEQKFVQNRWPLIERGMNRTDCLRWMEERQYPRPPKSSCIFCPLRDMPAWRRMSQEQPEDFARACAFDDAIRPGFLGMEGTAYVHRQRLPLRDINFEAGGQVNILDEECEGVCFT